MFPTKNFNLLLDNNKKYGDYLIYVLRVTGILPRIYLYRREDVYHLHLTGS